MLRLVIGINATSIEGFTCMFLVVVAVESMVCICCTT
jgi:hypothetical protein